MAIETAIAAGESNRRVAAQHHVTEQSLRRHLSHDKRAPSEAVSPCAETPDAADEPVVQVPEESDLEDRIGTGEIAQTTAATTEARRQELQQAIADAEAVLHGACVAVETARTESNVRRMDRAELDLLQRELDLARFERQLQDEAGRESKASALRMEENCRRETRDAWNASATAAARSLQWGLKIKQLEGRAGELQQQFQLAGGHPVERAAKLRQRLERR